VILADHRMAEGFAILSAIERIWFHPGRGESVSARDREFSIAPGSFENVQGFLVVPDFKVYGEETMCLGSFFRMNPIEGPTDHQSVLAPADRSSENPRYIKFVDAFPLTVTGKGAESSFMADFMERGRKTWFTGNVATGLTGTPSDTASASTGPPLTLNRYDMRVLYFPQNIVPPLSI